MPKKLLFSFLLIFGYQTLPAQSLSDTLSIQFQNKSIVQKDALRSLSGLHPSIQITSTGGISGSGTNAIIRGYSSLNATSDPLIIIDGIRFDSGNNQNSSVFSGGGTVTTPNRSFDISASEIIDIEILSSLDATIRYGEEAKDGVIIITTNREVESSLNDELSFQVQQSVYRTQIASRPDYQDEFGMGFDGTNFLTYSSWGPSFSEQDPSFFPGSFQGINDGIVLLNHPLSNHSLTNVAFPEFDNATYPYIAQPSAIDEFFNSGYSSETSIAAKYKKGGYFLNANYSGNWENGFTPNNTFKRNSFGTYFSYPLIESVRGRSTLNFIFTDVFTPTLSAGGGSGRDQIDAGPSIFSDLFYTPRSLGFDFPYQNPESGGSAYYRVGNDILNPRWTAENAKAVNKTNRIYGKTEVEFSPTGNLNILYRYSFESYDENQEYRLNPTFIANYPYQTGLFQTIELDRNHYEQLLLITLDNQGNENLKFDSDFGLNYNSEFINETGLESVDIRQLGIFEHDNFRSQIPVSSFTNDEFTFFHERRSFGFFAKSIAYLNNWVYSELGLRGEWNSSLQHQNLSAWYPAVSLGVVPTNKTGNIGPLSHLKFEAGYFTSGRGVFTEEELRVQNRASVAINNSLKPERSIEKQLSLQLGLFNQRLMIESVYFQRTHTDLISRIADRADPVFSSILDNLMGLESEGLELSLVVVPVEASLRWSMHGMFRTISTEVVEYTGTFNAVQLGNSLSNRGNVAIIDEPFLSMYGTQILRVDEVLQESNPNFRNVPVGTPIIDDNGDYFTGQVGLIGNPNPKWNASLINQFNYKNFALSVQVDYQHGGDMYSTWIASLLGRGVVTETAKDDRNRTFVLEGVRIDGTPNDLELSTQQYYFNNIGFGPDETRVFDMTHIRIAHIGLDYSLPDHLITNTRINGVKISISVENAFLYMPNIPKGLGFDPNVNSNGAGVNNLGFEYLTGPASRRIGGSVQFNF